MMRVMATRFVTAVVLAAGFALGTGYAQDKVPSKTMRVLPSPVPGDSETSAALAQLGYSLDSVVPMKDPTTVDQIHEYLRVSGDMDAYRTRWIAAVDKNRSIGAPYWPESFWVAIKSAMQQKDLTPMYIVMLQHGVSRELMQNVLDTYHRVGATLFVVSPAGFRLRSAEAAVAASDTDKVRLAETLGVIGKVYAGYKPQITAARAKYLVEHPHYVGK